MTNNQRPQLTTRQKDVLEYIRDFTYRNGYVPSVRDIARAIGVKSPSTVQGYLDGLEKAGYIRREPSQNRSIVLIEEDEWRQKELTPIPLIGNVHAGLPATAEQNVEDVYPFPLQFIGSDSAFMLEVKGDSMMDAGILEGDVLFVKEHPNAENGDIVVAMVGDEGATVKRFYKESDHIRLQPENDAYDPIICQDVKIVGRVIGVYRKYN